MKTRGRSFCSLVVTVGRVYSRQDLRTNDAFVLFVREITLKELSLIQHRVPLDSINCISEYIMGNKDELSYVQPGSNIKVRYYS